MACQKEQSEYLSFCCNENNFSILSGSHDNVRKRRDYRNKVVVNIFALQGLNAHICNSSGEISKKILFPIMIPHCDPLGVGHLNLEPASHSDIPLSLFYNPRGVVGK